MKILKKSMVNRRNKPLLKLLVLIFSSLIILLGIGYFLLQPPQFIQDNFYPKIGTPIDSLNGVKVYYNGKIGNVSGRSLTSDKYNLGLKYQCVEFVKRYYYKHYNHKMPNSWGHAKDFFDSSVSDGEMNIKRNLIQYTNPSKTKPKIGDILIFDSTRFNKFGHVAIISNVDENEVEIIQQNGGSFASTRVKFDLKKTNGIWTIADNNLLGRLRK